MGDWIEDGRKFAVVAVAFFALLLGGLGWYNHAHPCVKTAPSMCETYCIVSFDMGGGVRACTVWATEECQVCVERK
jgi:hypothetical protein